MPFTVKIVVAGVTEAMAKVEQIGGRLNNERENAVLGAVNQVAAVWRKNFDGEGSMVGGWRDLAEATQRRREYYGYGAEHPILLRYGALRGVVVDFFQDARGSGSTSRSDNYSKQETRGTLELSNGLARLSAQGWKIANQYGYNASNGAGETPARPFWFVDNNVIAAARKGVVDWVLQDVLR